MTARQTLKRLRRVWQMSWWVHGFWLSLPIGVAAAVVMRLLGQLFGTSSLVGIATGLLFWAVISWVRRHSFPTEVRVAAHLDRRFPEMEDSTGLISASPETLSTIAKMQRARSEDTLLKLFPRADVSGASWHSRAAISLLAVALLVNVPVLFQVLGSTLATTDSSPILRVAQAQLDERHHVYTQREAYRHDGLSADVQEFSDVRWTFQLVGDVDEASVRFADQQSVPLFRASEGYWQSDWIPGRAGNYALLLNGNPVMVGGAASHRLVMIPDAPPEISIVQPVQRVFALTEGSATEMTVALTTRDDFGVQSLRTVVNSAEGDGEQVDFERSTIDLTEQLSGMGRPVTTNLDLVALGAAPGRELYVTFEVEDNRPSGPQMTSSASLIVRWARDATTADILLDNPIVNIEPELFRSQRQIIIDSEALMDERDGLNESEFASRAQGLAFDERALRFRYGAFMGEEASGEPAAGARALGGQTHYPGDGHDHGDADFTAPAQREFGDVMAAIAPYAHFHDQEEQATVFDPETRRLLRQALSAMWRAEGALLQHDPDSSLPHQYRALALIKRIQRRSRTFVRRVGVPITPVDEARRLEGELEDIPAARALLSNDPERLPAPVAAIDQLLATGFDQSAHDALVDWVEQGIENSVRRQDTTAEADYRDILATLTTWRADSECGTCADRIGLLWAKVAPLPVAAPRRAPNVDRWFAVDESSL
ncbi:MAG: hypothetical protein AAGL69_14175 [Pseudomonadota bacterium]